MIAYIIDGVLLLALLLTSLRVGAMYRELKRLRGYQHDYVEVFGKTTSAADHIGAAVRHLASEGRDVLERLEARVAEAQDMVRRLEDLARPPANESRRERATSSDDIGTYSRQSVSNAAVDTESQRFRNEILKFGSDNRQPQERRDETAAGPTPSLLPKSGREFRLAPSVRTVRAASGNS